VINGVERTRILEARSAQGNKIDLYKNVLQ